MSKASGGHRNGSPDAADTLTPTRLAEIGGSIPIAQVQELRKIPSALPSLFPPSRVQNYFLEIASPTSLRLTWSTPASNGGSTLLGYKIRVVNQDTGATVYQSATYDSSPFVATGLTTGVSYQVRVAPVNAIGQGEEDFSDSIPGATIPGAPTGLSATAGDGTAALSWTAPASDGGGEITGYVVEYTPAGGSAETSGTGSAGTTFTLNSVNSTVTNGVTYSVRVAAANAAGQGPYSSAVNVTLPTVPGAPTALSSTAGNAQVPLTWTAPASNGGSAITGYVVEWTPSGGSATTVNTGSATASYTKTGLANGTAYTFRVAAINSVGTGPYSSSVTVTPVAASSLLAVVSGSPTGSGTTASPYLVASDTTPAPIYKATGPGQFRISYTAARTFTECGKSDCTTYRRNDAVFFDRVLGTFWEKIRSNLDSYVYDGNNRANAPRNSALLLTAAAYMGQQMQPRSSNAVTNQMQPATARVAFQPQDANFSISSIGSRALIGSGTAELPFMTSAPFSVGRNERTVVFRANGSGVVCISTNQTKSEAIGLWVGGTASSFTGGSQRTLDSYHSSDQYGIFPSPSFNYVWVNDGEIFSLAGATNDKTDSWIQETGHGLRPLMAWAAPTASQTGLYLMNEGPAFYAANPVNGNWGAHLHANNPTLWTGLGTAASPLNMPTWSKSVPHTGHAQNLFASRDGTFTFDFETQAQVCDKEGCRWEAPAVVKSLRHGIASGNSHGIYSYINPTTTFAHTNGAGSGTFSVKAFTGVNFCGPSSGQIAFRITNLVFTPS